MPPVGQIADQSLGSVLCRETRPSLDTCSQDDDSQQRVVGGNCPPERG